MTLKKKSRQSKTYEFVPNSDITIAEIKELAELIRIGVGGHVLDMASDELRKHFVEVKK